MFLKLTTRQILLGDKNKVLRDLGVHLSGEVELSGLARSIDASRWTDHGGKLISLARLIEVYNLRILQKPKKLQRGNWEIVLSEPMQQCELK